MEIDPVWELIKFRREDYGHFADRCGYSVQYIRDLASGRKPITAEFRRRAAFAFDLPIHWLFRSFTGPEQDPPEASEAPVTCLVGRD